MSNTKYVEYTSGNLPKDTQTDWEQVATTTDAEIDAATAADPDAQPTDEAFWKDAEVVMPRRKRA